MGLWLSPAVQTRDPIIKPESVSSRADNGRGLILRAMTKVPCYNLFITYSNTFFKIMLIKNIDVHFEIRKYFPRELQSGKQTSAHAGVCFQDLQVPREIFPVFLTKGRLIYILHLQKCPFLPFMTPQSDVNDTLTLRHLFCFWRDLVRFNVRKDLSPLRKLSLLSSSTILKIVSK